MKTCLHITRGTKRREADVFTQWYVAYSLQMCCMLRYSHSSTFLHQHQISQDLIVPVPSLATRNLVICSVC